MEGPISKENTPVPKIEINPDYADFVPREFVENPLLYFESNGVPIKSGEPKIDQNGIVREDPTTVRDFPVWTNSDRKEVRTVGKKVNVAKGKVSESGDPFYEYKILQLLAKMGLPAAKPVAKTKQNGTCLIVMERILGIRWSEKDQLDLKNRGYSDEDIAGLYANAEQMMADLKVRFEEVGVVRGWKLQDMVFQIDIDNKKITSIIPTDWERTKIVQK